MQYPFIDFTENTVVHVPKQSQNTSYTFQNIENSLM